MTDSRLFDIGERTEVRGGFLQRGDEAQNEWLTPPDLLMRLGGFDLDPCAPVQRPWPMADHHYTIEDDGLAQPWFGRVWLNPPYGSETGDWLSRLADHGRGTALVFARTETVAFHEHVWPRATGVLFMRGRLHFRFIDGTRGGTAGAPSVLIAYGPADAAVLSDAQDLGRYVELRKVADLESALTNPSFERSPGSNPGGVGAAPERPWEDGHGGLHPPGAHSQGWGGKGREQT